MSDPIMIRFFHKEYQQYIAVAVVCKVREGVEGGRGYCSSTAS